VIKHLRTVGLLVVVFAIVSGGECEISSLGEILDEPGRIVVTNAGSEVAVVAIIGPDVKSYPTLGSGATASAETNVGGAYQVVVVMTPEQTLEYGDELANLKRTVQKLVDGSLSTEEKTYLFTKLAGINAALASLQQGSSASCSGIINLRRDNPEIVNATVAWVTQSGTGFWEMTCGSN
jgi:hypothetical protein